MKKLLLIASIALISLASQAEVVVLENYMEAGFTNIEDIELVQGRDVEENYIKITSNTGKTCYITESYSGQKGLSLEKFEENLIYADGFIDCRKSDGELQKRGDNRLSPVDLVKKHLFY